MSIGLGADNHRFDLRIGPDLLDISDDFGIERFGTFLCPGGIVIPNGLHLHVLAAFEEIDKARGMDVSTPNKSEGHGFLVVSGEEGRHACRSKGRGAGSLEEVATGKL